MRSASKLAHDNATPMHGKIVNSANAVRSWVFDHGEALSKRCSKPVTRPSNSLIFVIVLFFVLTYVTTTVFMADTSDYAGSIVARLEGRYYEFWDFGHLLWRPLGWSLIRVFEVIYPSLASSDLRYATTVLLIGISWIAGFFSLYLMHRLASCTTKHFWSASLVTAGFASSLAFLNFSRSGAPYVPGLAMLVLAVYALEQDDLNAGRISWALGGGVAIGGAVLLWFPYVLVVPAVILIPIILRRSWRNSLVAFASFGLVCCIVYVSVVWTIGLHSIPQILNWVRASNHSIDHIKGVSRAIFGFSRSFIDMDRDGTLFKRYLLRDPFNAVSLADLLRLSLGKLLLFYVWIASIIMSLVVTKQKRALVLLVAALLPVLVFAVDWQGGDKERYLAAYPFLFFAVAIVLKNRPSVLLRCLVIGFIPLMLFVNTSALLRTRINKHNDQVARRLQGIPSDVHARVFVTHNQDDAFIFVRSLGLASSNLNRTFQMSDVLDLGRADTPLWRVTFARLVTRIWDKGEAVWLSRRLFVPVPKPEWNWVEGQDPRVSWRDLTNYFTPLEVDNCVGGEDGFCLLRNSQANRAFLQKTVDDTSLNGH